MKCTHFNAQWNLEGVNYHLCNFRTLLYILHLFTLHAADQIGLLYQLSVLTRKLEPTFDVSVVCSHVPSATKRLTHKHCDSPVQKQSCKTHSWEADNGSSNTGIPCLLCDRQVHRKVVACSGRSATRATAEPQRINTCSLVHSDVMRLWRKTGRKVMRREMQEFLFAKQTKNRTGTLKPVVSRGTVRHVLM